MSALVERTLLALCLSVPTLTIAGILAPLHIGRVLLSAALILIPIAVLALLGVLTRAAMGRRQHGGAR